MVGKFPSTTTSPYRESCAPRSPHRRCTSLGRHMPSEQQTANREQRLAHIIRRNSHHARHRGTRKDLVGYRAPSPSKKSSFCNATNFSRLRNYPGFTRFEVLVPSRYSDTRSSCQKSRWPTKCPCTFAGDDYYPRHESIFCLLLAFTCGCCHGQL